MIVTDCHCALSTVALKQDMIMVIKIKKYNSFIGTVRRVVGGTKILLWCISLVMIPFCYALLCRCMICYTFVLTIVFLSLFAGRSIECTGGNERGLSRRQLPHARDQGVHWCKRACHQQRSRRAGQSSRPSFRDRCQENGWITGENRQKAEYISAVQRAGCINLMRY